MNIPVTALSRRWKLSLCEYLKNFIMLLLVNISHADITLNFCCTSLTHVAGSIKHRSHKHQFNKFQLYIVREVSQSFAEMAFWKQKRLPPQFQFIFQLRKLERKLYGLTEEKRLFRFFLVNCYSQLGKGHWNKGGWKTFQPSPAMATAGQWACCLSTEPKTDSPAQHSAQSQTERGRQQ